MAEWLKKVGKKCKTGVKISINHDFIVRGDFICQFHYPADFLKDVDKFYKNTESFEEVDYNILTELVNRKIDVQIIIIRNPILADTIRDETMKYFKPKEGKK